MLAKYDNQCLLRNSPMKKSIYKESRNKIQKQRKRGIFQGKKRKKDRRKAGRGKFPFRILNRKEYFIYEIL